MSKVGKGTDRAQFGTVISKSVLMRARAAVAALDGYTFARLVEDAITNEINRLEAEHAITIDVPKRAKTLKSGRPKKNAA